MKTGLEDRFFEVFDQHYPDVRRFVRAVIKDDFTADDLTQETFVRARKSIETFKENAATAPWLLKIAYNLCRDHYRKKKRHAEQIVPLADDAVPFENCAAEESLQRQEMSACVQNQILLLPEANRAVLVLYDIIGFTQREMAEILDISTENVKVRLHRSRLRLKEILERNCTFERDERNVFVCRPKCCGSIPGSAPNNPFDTS